MRKLMLAGSFLLSAILFAACSKSSSGDSPAPGSKTGSITISATTNPDTDGKSSRAETSKTSTKLDNYTLTITGPGSFSYTGLWSEGATFTDLAPGNYTVKLVSDVNYTMPAFNWSIYEGSDTKEVKAGQSTKFTITCTQINAGVRFAFDPSILVSYPDLKATVAVKDEPTKSMEYAATNAADTLFFDAPSTLNISLKDGSTPVNIGGQPSKDISVKAREVWTVTLKTSSTTPGEIEVEAEVNTDVDAESPEFGVGDAEGEGTFASPLSISDAINTLPLTDVWVKGFVTGATEVSRAGNNAVLLRATPNATTGDAILIYIADMPDLAVLADESYKGVQVMLRGDIVGRSDDFVSPTKAVLTNISDLYSANLDAGVNGTEAITFSGLKLKDIGKDRPNFRMGATIKTDNMFGGEAKPATNLLIQRDFTSLTHEFELKMSEQLKLDKDIMAGITYRWNWHEQFKTFVAENNIAVHGHALTWPQDEANVKKFYADNGIDWESETPEELKARLVSYIKNSMLRYKYVRSWDVVNEAFENATGAYRPSMWQKAFGEEANYVEEIFKIARQAVKDFDLPCKLFYNDYKTNEFPNKRDAITREIKAMNERYAAANNGEVLIDGIGMQTHLTIANGTEAEKAKLKTAFDKTNETGLLVHISELSVSLTEEEDQVPQNITQEMLDQQVDLYNYIYYLALNNVPEDKLWGITTWGLDDGSSIYKKRAAMLYDANLNAKKSYFDLISTFAQK